jgi:hypothetical protein
MPKSTDRFASSSRGEGARAEASVPYPRFAKSAMKSARASTQAGSTAL